MILDIVQLARISLKGSEAHYGAFCDRCAVTPSAGIMVLSAAAPTRIIAGISSLISKGGPAVTISFDYVPFTDGSTSQGWDYDNRCYADLPVERHYKDLRRHDQGYVRILHKMRHGFAHCIWVAKQPGLLLNTGTKAIGQALRDPDVCTTPFLPEWVPYIAGKLREKKLLNDLWGFQCQAAILKPGSTAEIDAIVLEGGRDGEIAIPA